MAGGRLLVLEANAEPREYVDRVRVIEVTGGRGRVVARPAFPITSPVPTPVPENGPGSGIIIVAAAFAAFAGVAFLGWRRLRS
jgi:hypothetical protein